MNSSETRYGRAASAAVADRSCVAKHARAASTATGDAPYTREVPVLAQDVQPLRVELGVDRAATRRARALARPVRGREGRGRRGERSGANRSARYVLIATLSVSALVAVLEDRHLPPRRDGDERGAVHLVRSATRSAGACSARRARRASTPPARCGIAGGPTAEAVALARPPASRAGVELWEMPNKSHLGRGPGRPVLRVRRGGDAGRRWGRL